MLDRQLKMVAPLARTSLQNRVIEKRVASAIGEVTNAAASSDRATADVAGAVERMSDESQLLSDEVERFLDLIRSS